MRHIEDKLEYVGSIIALYHWTRTDFDFKIHVRTF